jgi:hypothetical protein
MMELGKAHVDDLSIAIEEMKKVAQIEGVETLLIVATQHRSDGSFLLDVSTDAAPVPWNRSAGSSGWKWKR